jgi:opacity protein-like surface antigen
MKKIKKIFIERFLKLENKIIALTCFTALLFVGTTNAMAQDDELYKKAELGIRLMPTVTSLDVKTSSGGEVSGEAVLGFGAGILLGFNFNKYIGVQGEVIYSSISQKSYDKNVERKLNLRYVNIPVLVSLNTGKSRLINLNLVAGPQVGINMGSSISTSGANDVYSQAVLSVKKNDFGFAYGAGFDVALNPDHTVRLSVGYRGVLGLLDVSDESTSTTSDSYYVLDRSHVNTHAAYFGLSIMLL